MIPTRRTFVAASAYAVTWASVPPSVRAAQSAGRVFTPEMFGAKGDGRTNDTDAFASLAAAVNADGGGTIELRRTTYIVGRQLPGSSSGSTRSFEGQKILEFVGCRAALVIRGNGARLRCAGGLRFGVFDAASGQPTNTQMPYFGPGVAFPYHAMIRVERSEGPVLIERLELDGNVGELLIGGRYGDVGWQVPGTGIALINNRGDEIVRDVHAHNHPLDGLLIDGDDRSRRFLPTRRVERSRFEYNGRQGCSIVGGRGYAFQECAFSHTGRSAVSSAPGAGVDIEAEGGKQNRDHSFKACEFHNNAGAGMVADTGDSDGASFDLCTFVGTTSWSAWPNKPRFVFRNCSFAGALTRAYGDLDPRRAAQFTDCVFSDVSPLAAETALYRGTNADGPLADLSDAKNVAFTRCAFLATRDATLPWSTGAIYADCRMEQRSSTISYPRGTFVGRNSINGKVDLYGSRNLGDLILNGVQLEPDRTF